MLFQTYPGLRLFQKHRPLVDNLADGVSRQIDIRVVADDELPAYPAQLAPGRIDYHGRRYISVGNDDIPVIIGMQMSCQQIDPVNDACGSVNLDLISRHKRLCEQKNDSACHIAQRVAQRKRNRHPRSALDPRLRLAADQGIKDDADQGNGEVRKIQLPDTQKKPSAPVLPSRKDNTAEEKKGGDPRRRQVVCHLSGAEHVCQDNH